MSFDNWKLQSPYEGEQDPRDEAEEEEEEEEEMPSRVVGYIGKKGRSLVWDNLDGTFSVVVDCRYVRHFTDVTHADTFAVGHAFGQQFRMGS